MLKLHKAIWGFIIASFSIQSLALAQLAAPTQMTEQMPQENTAAVGQNNDVVNHYNAVLEMAGPADQSGHQDEVYDNLGRLIERTSFNEAGQTLSHEIWTYGADNQVSTEEKTTYNPDSCTEIYNLSSCKKTQHEFTDHNPDAAFDYQVITYDAIGTNPDGSQWMVTDQRYKSQGDLKLYEANYYQGSISNDFTCLNDRSVFRRYQLYPGTNKNVVTMSGYLYSDGSLQVELFIYTSEGILQSSERHDAHDWNKVISRKTYDSEGNLATKTEYGSRYGFEQRYVTTYTRLTAPQGAGDFGGGFALPPDNAPRPAPEGVEDTLGGEAWLPSEVRLYWGFSVSLIGTELTYVDTYVYEDEPFDSVKLKEYARRDHLDRLMTKELYEDGVISEKHWYYAIREFGRETGEIFEYRIDYYVNGVRDRFRYWYDNPPFSGIPYAMEYTYADYTRIEFIKYYPDGKVKTYMGYSDGILSTEIEYDRSVEGEVHVAHYVYQGTEKQLSREEVYQIHNEAELLVTAKDYSNGSSTPDRIDQYVYDAQTDLVTSWTRSNADGSREEHVISAARDTDTVEYYVDDSLVYKDLIRFHSYEDGLPIYRFRTQGNVVQFMETYSYNDDVLATVTVTYFDANFRVIQRVIKDAAGNILETHNYDPVTGNEI